MIGNKEERNKFLYALYQKALEISPIYPTDVMFGMKKVIHLNPKTWEQRIEEQDVLGFSVGETLGLDNDTVRVYVAQLVDDKLAKYWGSKCFQLSKICRPYLESLEENKTKTTTNTNTINIHNSSLFQVQQDADNSPQTQNIRDISQNERLEFLDKLQDNIDNLGLAEVIREDLLQEIAYAQKNITKDKSFLPSLDNIVEILKAVPPNLIANLLAAPIPDIIRRLLKP